MPKEQSLKLMRHLLGSIDLPDIEEKEVSEADRSAYCSAIYAVFPVLERDIKKMLHAQLMFSSNEAGNWEQVVFGRGTFNGMDLLLEKWRLASIEHQAPKEDKNNPMLKV